MSYFERNHSGITGLDLGINDWQLKPPIWYDPKSKPCDCRRPVFGHTRDDVSMIEFAPAPSDGGFCLYQCKHSGHRWSIFIEG